MVLTMLAMLVVVLLWAAYAVAVHVAAGAHELPRWPLLGPLAIALLATATARPAAVAAGLLVGFVGVVHLGWAAGGSWPAQDREQLDAFVLPRQVASRPQAARRAPRFPSRAMTLAVMCGFFAMSACLLVPGAPWLAVAIAGVFALRGIGGLIYWSRRRESSEGGSPSPFFVYNRLLYSPVCLFVAALAVASAAGTP